MLLYREIIGVSFLAFVGRVSGYDSTTSASSTHTGKRPNFVVLFMDDLGYGDLGFTGHPTTKTPNLDRLAWNGKVLTTWYSGCNVCSGSRAALMTGRQVSME
jgi:arylsulfatase A